MIVDTLTHITCIRQFNCQRHSRLLRRHTGRDSVLHITSEPGRIWLQIPQCLRHSSHSRFDQKCQWLPPAHGKSTIRHHRCSSFKPPQLQSVHYGNLRNSGAVPRFSTESPSLPFVRIQDPGLSIQNFIPVLLGYLLRTTSR
jgi:hypothetical protein